MGEADIVSIPGGGACDHPAPDADAAIRRVGDSLHRLNVAIVSAVEAGLTVELVRCSRFHGGNGRWGDQMVPVVKVPEGKDV